MYGQMGHTLKSSIIIKTPFYPLKFNKRTNKNIYLQHFTDIFAFVKHVF